jgi:SAM-dependent methyltransferase
MDSINGVTGHEREDWGKRAQRGFLGSGIDPADTKGCKNLYIDILQKMALEDVLELKGDEIVLDFGCGSGRIAYWIAPRVKEVIGLEVTPEMIELAEKNREAKNVRFLVYDGVHFPTLPGTVDLIISVGVLQILNKVALRRTLSALGQYVKAEGKFYLIEQASDSPTVERPGVSDYLQAFEESKLEVLNHFPIRKGRSWLLYLIRYGVIPRSRLFGIARKEIRRLREERRRPISYYRDYLFVLRKP